MINGLGNPEPFFPESETFGERSKFGMARGKNGTGEHRGQQINTEALVLPRPLEGCHGLPEAVDRLTIVALVMVGYAQVLVRQRVQDTIAASRGKREGALGDSNGLVICAHRTEMHCQKHRDLSQPMRIVEGRRESLGLA
jgi:hypothetical protein